MINISLFGKIRNNLVLVLLFLSLSHLSSCGIGSKQSKLLSPVREETQTIFQKESPLPTNTITSTKQKVTVTPFFTKTDTQVPFSPVLITTEMRKTDPFTEGQLASGLFFALVIDPISPNILYAGTDPAGVVKTWDRGKTWNYANWFVTYSLSSHVNALEIDPNTPSVLYAGTLDGVFKSTDGGGTWNSSIKGFGNNILVFSLAIDPKTPGTIYAGTSDGVRKSTDGGENWQTINNGLVAKNNDVWDIAIDPITTTTIYAVLATDIIKSIDGGDHWNYINQGLNLNAGPTDLAIDPVSNTKLYLATYYSGVYKSSDSGEHWSEANTGLTTVTIGALMIDPRIPNMVFAGTMNGVFKSADGGRTWNLINPAHLSFICDMTIDPMISTIYYASNDGIFAISY